MSAAWHETIRTNPGDPLEAVHGVCQRVAQRVRGVVEHGGLPVVVGGDHSCAIGTWKGVASALRTRGPLGLIWIDAHMDAHTPQTTPSGALHGMPLACLLGYGDSRLTALGNGLSLQPQHVCLIGVRSYEAGEAALLKELGVRIYFMHEVARRGLAAVRREAVADVTTGSAGFGITVDLDALDPRDAPGVNTPVADGIGAGEMAAALAHVNAHPALAGIEIAEYNPERDPEHRAARVVEQLLDAMLADPQQTASAPMLIEYESHYGAHNYAPLPVVLTRGLGAYVWDDRGRRYLDMMSAYSAVSHGHCHPRVVKALTEQAQCLAACADICRRHNVLLICDEVQTGLGRTGRLFACEHERVKPDGLILGKALGGGLLPVSAFLARRDVMAVFMPGDHGSTFGGNPLAAAVGLTAIEVLLEEKLAQQAAKLGDYLLRELRALKSPLIREVRGKGMLIGVDINPAFATARTVCEKLLQHGVLSKETHQTVVRLAPPLIVTRGQLDCALLALRMTLAELDTGMRRAAGRRHLRSTARETYRRLTAFSAALRII